MTLILTQINKYGIIFATDSNITIDNTHTENGRKIFKIPHLKSALCLAGNYSVKNENMSNWMQNYIRNNQSQTLRQFTEDLSKDLGNTMSSDEKKNGCIMHISGFVKDNNNYHPEMWHISNIGLLSDGIYSQGDDKFHYSEDFWNRDWEKVKDNIINDTGYQYYINGFPSGRISFNIIGLYLHDFLWKIFWPSENKDPRLKEFRPPQNLEENEHLMKLLMHFICSMFELSNYYPKAIGGRIQSYKIKSPNQIWYTP